MATADKNEYISGQTDQGGEKIKREVLSCKYQEIRRGHNCIPYNELRKRKLYYQLYTIYKIGVITQSLS